MSHRTKNVKIVVPSVLSNFESEKRRAAEPGVERSNSALKPLRKPNEGAGESSGDDGSEGSVNDTPQAATYNTKNFQNLQLI